VNVFDDDDINAVCYPGGKIGINTGLIDKLSPTDDELAAVMDHEIGHALREHGQAKMSQALVADAVVKGVANSRPKNAALARDITKLGAQLFISLPFSREMELEADVIGLELTTRAGYDPRQAVNFWKKMEAQASDKGSLEFFETHPKNERRLAALEENLPKVMPLFQAAADGTAVQATTQYGASTTLNAGVLTTTDYRQLSDPSNTFREVLPR
jgi:predicted Zn-dependent protease